MKLRKIISGGQTGADQGGLAAGKTLGLETGGTAPKGYLTDNGQKLILLKGYGLTESPMAGYPARTISNVIDSDGTLLVGNMDSPGSALTMKVCIGRRKPYVINPSPSELRAWLEKEGIEVLNVAGNRERTNPGIAMATKTLIVIAIKGEE